jgi:hypothetical protein
VSRDREIFVKSYADVVVVGHDAERGREGPVGDGWYTVTPVRPRGSYFTKDAVDYLLRGREFSLPRLVTEELLAAARESDSRGDGKMRVVYRHGKESRVLGTLYVDLGDPGDPAYDFEPTDFGENWMGWRSKKDVVPLW